MNIEIKLATSEQEIARVAPVMQELRTQLSADTLISRMCQQQADGYKVAYAEQDGEIVGAAGFVITTKLSWGLHLYVDDLVTSAQCRSKGVGYAMLDWLRQYAKAQGCGQLHLDSGVQRFAAHRFYLRHGFAITGHHFAIDQL